MTKSSPEEAWWTARLSADDLVHIAECQRLAALDPDIRMAMTNLWWIAQSVGLRVSEDRPIRLVQSPFSSLGMELAGYRPDDF